MSKIEFDTQICTTKEQSKRLFKLGLNPDTADMSWVLAPISSEYPHVSLIPYSETKNRITYNIIPAWSLHRLYKMCPGCLFKLRPALHKTVTSNGMFYCTENNDVKLELSFSQHCNLYNNIIDCIKWLIKNNYFNKDYLK